MTRLPARLALLVGLFFTPLAASPLAAQEPGLDPPPQSPPLSPSTPAAPAPLAGGVFASPLTLTAQPLRGLAAGVASQILTGERGGPIALRVLGVPIPDSGRTAGAPAAVRLYVELDGASLLEALAAARSRLELYAYVLSPTGSVAAHLAEVFSLEVDEIGEAVWQAGLQYIGQLDVPAGEYVLRVLVRDAATGAHGLDTSVLRVPEAGEPTVVALFPIPEGRDAWVPVRGSGLGEDRRRFQAGGREVRPTTVPVLADGQPSGFYLFSDGIGTMPPNATVELRRGEEVVATVPLQLAGGIAEPLEGVPANFTLTGVGASAYRLFVRLGSDAARSGGQEIAVAPPMTGELLWTDLRLGNVAAVEAARQAAEVERRDGLSRRERRQLEEQRARGLAEEYRSALRSLSASGDSWAGRTALLDFESRALTDLGDVIPLRDVERAVAEQLAKHDPETLVPLMDAHSALYRTYRERRRFALLTHSRLHTEWLAELYAATVGSQGAHVVAARALASLAGYLQEAVLPTASRRLYEQALLHEPGNEAALLGLAISFERYGDYSQAVDILRRLSDTRPSLAEGRLRLAVNLGRIGDGDAAVEHLRQLLQPAQPLWIRILAYEELARHLIAAGRDSEAVELLSTASSELGDPAGILVLLAHLLDRQEQPHQAAGVLSRLDPVRSGDSPRRRYDGWPESALAEVRSQLQATAASRIPLLHQSLEVAE